MATVIPPFDRFAGLRIGAQNLAQGFATGLQRQDLQSQQQRGFQQLAQLFPNLNLQNTQGITDPRLLGVVAQLGLAQQAQQASLAQAIATKTTKSGTVQEIEDPDNPGQFIKVLLDPDTGEIVRKLGKVSPSRVRAQGKEIQRLQSIPNRTLEQQKRLDDLLIPKAASTVVTVNPETAQRTASEQSEILTSFQTEADKANAADPNTNVLTVVKTNAKGQPFLAKESREKVSSTQLDKLKALKNIRDLLTNIALGYEPGFVGFADAPLGKVREVIGTASALEVDFRRNVKDIADTLLRNRSGAQINEIEAKRLLEIAVDLGIGDKPFISRLESFTGNIDTRIDNTIRALTAAGFNTQDLQLFMQGKRPLGFLKARQTKTLKDAARKSIDVRNLTDEELDAELEGLR